MSCERPSESISETVATKSALSLRMHMLDSNYVSFESGISLSKTSNFDDFITDHPRVGPLMKKIKYIAVPIRSSLKIFDVDCRMVYLEQFHALPLALVCVAITKLIFKNAIVLY